MSSVWLTAIHHLQVAAGPRQPAALPLLGGRHRDRIVVPHGPHDPRAVDLARGGHDVDEPDRLLGGRVASVDKHGAAHPNAVAAGEFAPLDLAVVDERAVGTLEVADDERLAHAANLGVTAGNLVVVEPDGIARLTADGQRPLVRGEIVAGSAIPALDDEQRRQRSGFPGVMQLRCGDSGTRRGRRKARGRMIAAGRFAAGKSATRKT
jgi:hypothetical protein